MALLSSESIDNIVAQFLQEQDEEIDLDLATTTTVMMSVDNSHNQNNFTGAINGSGGTSLTNTQRSRMIALAARKRTQDDVWEVK